MGVKRGVLIDFFGCPGSGKTVVAHALADTLRSWGYTVQEDIYTINNKSAWARRVITKTRAALCFTSKHFVFLYRLFSALGGSSFGGLAEILRMWVNVCFVLQSINGSDKDYVIADQGIVQIAVALTVQSNKASIPAVINLLKQKLFIPARFVWVVVDPEKSIERLMDRQHTERDFEAPCIRTFMRQFQSGCFEAASVLECMTLDNNESMIGANWVNKVERLAQWIIKP